MFYKKLFVASILFITTSSSNAATSVLESIINLEDELITTMATMPTEAAYKPLITRCDTLVTTINKTHPHSFVTLYHTLLTELANHYGLDDATPSTTIAQLIDYHQLPQSPAIKTLFTLNCVQVLLPYLLEPAKNTSLSTITRQTIKQHDRLLQRIYKALKIKPARSWLKKRHLLTLLTGITISIVVYLAYAGYTELKRMQKEETARLKALQQQTEVLQSVQATMHQQQEVIAANSAQHETLTQQVATLHETINALNATNRQESASLFSTQNHHTEALEELKKTLLEQTSNTTNILNELNIRVESQQQEYTASLAGQSGAFAASQTNTIAAFNELVGTIKQQNRQFNTALNQIATIVSDSIDADKTLSDRENSTISSFLDGTTLNLNDATKAITAIGSIVIAADRIASMTRSLQEPDSGSPATESNLRERLRNL